MSIEQGLSIEQIYGLKQRTRRVLKLGGSTVKTEIDHWSGNYYAEDYWITRISNPISRLDNPDEYLQLEMQWVSPSLFGERWARLKPDKYLVSLGSTVLSAEGWAINHVGISPPRKNDIRGLHTLRTQNKADLSIYQTYLQEAEQSLQGR